MIWRPRAMVRTDKRHPVNDRHVQSIGIKVGYWPCLLGPFLTVWISRWRIDLWCGLPSYAAHDKVDARRVKDFDAYLTARRDELVDEIFRSMASGRGMSEKTIALQARAQEIDRLANTLRPADVPSSTTRPAPVTATDPDLMEKTQ